MQLKHPNLQARNQISSICESKYILAIPEIWQFKKPLHNKALFESSTSII
jgi:hypothetical protein